MANANGNGAAKFVAMFLQDVVRKVDNTLFHFKTKKFDPKAPRTDKPEVLGSFVTMPGTPNYNTTPSEILNIAFNWADRGCNPAIYIKTTGRVDRNGDPIYSQRLTIYGPDGQEQDTGVEADVVSPAELAGGKLEGDTTEF